MTGETILWKRLDTEGHDFCSLTQVSDDWRAEGTATFLHENLPACLHYQFSCDAQWRARSASISGWVGNTKVELHIDRSATGTWRLNGLAQQVPTDVTDIDLGFTPATNILPIRRFALAIGDETPAPAAYLSFPEMRLDLLDQSYRRLDATRYAYEAPRFGYRATLEVSEMGFVRDYPELFKAVGLCAD